MLSCSEVFRIKHKRSKKDNLHLFVSTRHFALLMALKLSHRWIFLLITRSDAYRSEEFILKVLHKLEKKFSKFMNFSSPRINLFVSKRHDIKRRIHTYSYLTWYFFKCESSTLEWRSFFYNGKFAYDSYIFHIKFSPLNTFSIR